MFQGGINTILRQRVLFSAWSTGVISFLVGLFGVACVAYVHSLNTKAFRKSFREEGLWKAWSGAHNSNAKEFRQGLREAPWSSFTGGVLGPVYVVRK